MTLYKNIVLAIFFILINSGISFSQVYTIDQSKTNPIILVEGENIAQLVESGFSSSVFRINQGDFELVE